MSRLDELEAKLVKATPRPWRYWPGYGISPRPGVTLSFDYAEDDEAPPDTDAVIALRNNADALIAIARAARTVIIAKENGHTAIEMVASQALRDALDRLEADQ